MVAWSPGADALGLRVILSFAPGTSLTSPSFNFPFGEIRLMHVKKRVQRLTTNVSSLPVQLGQDPGLPPGILEEKFYQSELEAFSQHFISRVVPYMKCSAVSFSNLVCL